MTTSSTEKLSIVPLGHRLLIKLDPVEEVSRGGIILPENNDRSAARTIGTIVGIGPNCWKAFDDGTPWAEVKDRVVISKYAGRRIKDPDNPELDLQVINDDDLQVAYIGNRLAESDIPAKKRLLAAITTSSITKLSIVPLGHRVLIKLDPVEEVSRGGIILPENNARSAERTIGTIVGIGPNCWKSFDGGTPWAKVEDRVLISKYAGKRIEDPDNPELDLQVINDDDLQVAYVGNRIVESDIPDEDMGA